jgi:hypothetical protein
MKVKLRDPSKDTGYVLSRSDYGKARYDYDEIPQRMTTRKAQPR